MKRAFTYLVLVTFVGCVPKLLVQTPPLPDEVSITTKPAALVSVMSSAAVETIQPTVFRRKVEWESWNDLSSFFVECNIEATTNLSQGWRVIGTAVQTNYTNASMSFTWDSTNMNEFVRVEQHWKIK